MTSATWIGTEGFESWSGFDGDIVVTLEPGKPTEVSDQLAAHLSESFPGLVIVATDGPKTAAAKRPAGRRKPAKETS